MLLNYKKAITSSLLPLCLCGSLKKSVGEARRSRSVSKSWHRLQNLHSAIAMVSYTNN
ncbi:hypothetical protein [uncultured Nostoc sp.]|uniref:hypothetical protein n=1 Tax=uncultured Nostoc sp. TaxID=340711 RepID=UPI0035CC809B